MMFFPLPASKIEYQFVVCVKGSHDVSFVSSWTIQFKKAINQGLDSIIAIIASVLETNYCLWGFYSLEAVWESRGTETLGSDRYSYYRYYEDIQKTSKYHFFKRK